MKDDLESILDAVNLALARLSQLRHRYPDDADKQEAIDDAEQGLGWIAKRLEVLESKSDCETKTD
jgi:hypothetical protein